MAKPLRLFPDTRIIKLLDYDDTGESTVTVQAATAGDFKKLSDLYAESSVTFADDGSRMTTGRWNGFEMQRERAYCCLVACNIPEADENGEDCGRPLFTFGKEKGRAVPGDHVKFVEQWNKIPQPLANEIYEAVLEMNPQWSDKKAGE